MYTNIYIYIYIFTNIYIYIYISNTHIHISTYSRAAGLQGLPVGIVGRQGGRLACGVRKCVFVMCY